MLKFHSRTNESAPRINLMGDSFSGKSGIALAAFPAMLCLSPNPDGLRVTGQKVCAITPDTIKVSMFDPFDFWRQFRLRSWNIVRAENGVPMTDEDGAFEPVIIKNPVDADIDGVSTVFVEGMEFPWWSREEDGSFKANYCGILLDDVDMVMKQALEFLLRQNSVDTSMLMGDKDVKKDGMARRAQTYADYRMTYGMAMIEFDDLAKKADIVVISTTKATTNDKNSQGKDVLFQPDFGSEAFNRNSPFIGLLEVNFHVNRDPRRSELVDIPTEFSQTAGRFERQLNTDPNDRSFWIKNRYKYASAVAPANLREVLRVEAPAYHCPYLDVFFWHETLSAEVCDMVYAKYKEQAKPGPLSNQDILGIWNTCIKEYSKQKYYCKDYSGLEEEIAESNHLTRFTWAFRDGLHRGYIKFRMYVERKRALSGV